jgi:hypothetical protein
MTSWSWLKEGAESAPVTRSDLEQLEAYADRLFGKVGIDVEFTHHFLDRVNDERNQRQITLAELTRLFKQEFKKWGKKIAQLGPDAEAVMKDMKTDVNMPFVLIWDANNQELDLIAKTVMRKDNFKTSDPEFAIEDAGAAAVFFSQFNPEEIKQLAIVLGVTIPVLKTMYYTVSGLNKIKKAITGLFGSKKKKGPHVIKKKHWSTVESAGVGIIDAQNTTADVKPGETRRQAAKLGITLNKDNEPPLLHAKATKNSQDVNKVAQLTERWKQLNEMDCKYGSYYCSTDRKVKCRQSPKKTRTTESALLAQQYQTKTLLNFLKKLTNAPVDVQLRKAIAKELASRGVKINEVEQIDVEKNDMGISPDLFQDALDGSGAAPTGDSVKNYAVARGEHGNTIYYFLLDGEKPFGMLKLVGAPGRGKMSMAMMLPEYQGKGVMPELYKLAIRDVGTIKSDVEQSAGGTAIWKRLAQDPDVVVYAYNEKSDEYAMVDDNLDSKFNTVNRAQDVKDLEAEETKELAHLLDLQLNGEIDREEYKRRVTDLRKAYEKEIVDTQDPGSVYFVATTTKGLDENFADGKKPGRKGLAKRVGVDCGKSVTALRKIAKNSSGEKQRMAHWCANMKSGRKKK